MSVLSPSLSVLSWLRKLWRNRRHLIRPILEIGVHGTVCVRCRVRPLAPSMSFQSKSSVASTRSFFSRMTVLDASADNFTVFYYTRTVCITDEYTANCSALAHYGLCHVVRTCLGRQCYCVLTPNLLNRVLVIWSI